MRTMTGYCCINTCLGPLTRKENFRQRSAPSSVSFLFSECLGAPGGAPCNGLFGKAPPERVRDFTRWSIWKGREICHLGAWKGPKGQTDEFYGFIKVGTDLLSIAPPPASPGLEPVIYVTDIFENLACSRLHGRVVQSWVKITQV